MLVMSAMTFWLMHATPGNFFDSLKLNPQISPATIARYEHMYHLDQPWVIQWAHWVFNVLKGEWGYSFYYNVPVANVLAPRMGATLILSLFSLILTWSLALPLGIMAALHKDRWLDKTLSVLALVSFATPGFFVAILLLYVFSFSGMLPLGGMTSAHHDELSWIAKIGDVLAHAIIPAIVLAFGSLAGLFRIMRNNVIQELEKPYVMAARGRGLSELQVVRRHVLPNAFNPLITMIGYEISGLLSGAALIEIVTSWPGIGSLMLTAVRSKDVYVVMASIVLGGVLLLIGNLVADILLIRLDPRIRYGQK